MTEVDGRNRYRQIWSLTVRDDEGLALPVACTYNGERHFVTAEVDNMMQLHYSTTTYAGRQGLRHKHVASTASNTCDTC